ncbi:AlbA family DNA-binding domain-containing protein [Albibacterium bauzanense]|uniref:Putative DNA-binding protein n=1 Tax=Albibacterium bauzanense TaxID=653929 RepID=A0A4R1LP84_9SPHI|nr:ATP-binding protein [Albibacterium bauzanense]TCK80888.1 putative DNA-binding protein [Albibacterium bauzanense]
MNYCEQIFKKSLRELKYKDLESFFQQEREESEILEFKSLGRDTMDATLTKHVFRTVSAFLNSSGGILILGSPVPTEIIKYKKKVKICHGILTLTSEYIEKDILINRISTAISYMPIGINIQVIEQENKYLYLIEVQESNSKPHQHNGIYHIRLDGQSKPAPHYLVDAMFNQIKYPDLDVTAFFLLHSETSDTIKLWAYLVITNESYVLNAIDYEYRIDFLSKGASSEDKTKSFMENMRLKVQPKTLAAGDKEEIEDHFYVDKAHCNDNLFIRINAYAANTPLISSYYQIKFDDKRSRKGLPIHKELFKNIKGQENKKIVQKLTEQQ